ncbi:MAG: hypothetical protein HYX68_13855 [Planctomycetes bacterium]|nr:hypothetical protein [Planctomycetota bacterium]
MVARLLAVKVVPAGLHLDRCATACCGPAAAERSAAFYFLPSISMLYRIRFEYARNIQASSKADAMKQMCASMKEHPESFIRDVQDAAIGQNKGPLWKRLITGR